MTQLEPWHVTTLLDALSARGRHPAIILSAPESIRVVDSATLGREARAIARGLHARGLGTGAAVAIWGPNSPAWIAAALGILSAGAVVVPIDDLADEAQFEAALTSSDARLLLVSQDHASAHAGLLTSRGIPAFLLDPQGQKGTFAPWRELLHARGDDPPPPAMDWPAVQFWTSGTTGSPKGFRLTHRNIASNVAAVADLHIVGLLDRTLLPLPLHHAYPFVVGMLSALSAGTALILPGGATGPLILKAVQDGAATAMIGVPRLYDALVAAIRARIAARGVIVRLGWKGLVWGVSTIRRATGLRLGRILFLPVRRRVGGELRYLISGGARLEHDTAEMLEVLGWTVLSGYGLAETASLFTANTIRNRRAGSAGRPMAGGQIRIAAPDAQGIGEIQLRGDNVTSGYLNNPNANHQAFTDDGWFRTGDLGYLDQDGYLFVTGREKEVLVLGGGKKVIPEDLERIYAGIPQIREIALLEEQGALVALVRPDPTALRAMGATNVRDGIRVVLSVKGQDLPMHERLSGFELTDQPFPRTRLGKIRRFLLRQMYEQARAGAMQRAAHEIGAEDTALLRDPAAAAVWSVLHARYPGRIPDLDVNFGLDLNLDSFAWMELAVALEAGPGVHLTETDIAGIETVRDLLRLAPQRRRGGGATPEPEPAIALDLAHWLAPTGAAQTLFGLILYVLNGLTMRGAFRLRVHGLAQVPREGAVVITPNHLSDLDAMAIAAALPLVRLRRLYWAGDIVRLFYNRASRWFCRVVHLFPVDERHPSAAVDIAAHVLAAGMAQVWFPEGWRSPDGRMQRFLPGIGQLLLRSGAPAVPAWIEGAFEALPRGRRLPRFHRITLTFGPPVAVAELLREGKGRTEAERVANALHDRVMALAADAGSKAP